MPDIEKVTRKITKRPDQIGGGKPGPGRKPGIPNRANGLLKDAIIQAAEEAGGEGGMVAYLTKQAKKHPAAFLGLIGRVLPLQVQDRGARPQIIVEIVRHKSGRRAEAGRARRHRPTRKRQQQRQFVSAAVACLQRCRG